MVNRQGFFVCIIQEFDRRKKGRDRSHYMTYEFLFRTSSNFFSYRFLGKLDTFNRQVRTRNMTKEEKAELRKAFADIPGTQVVTPERSRMGYPLNQFCMTLNREEGRREFRQDERAYLDKFPMTEEQKQAVLHRDWLQLLDLGGNIYYIWKIAACDRKSIQYLGGAMSGITEADFIAIMRNAFF